MDLNSVDDKAIEREIGRRIKEMRRRQNLSQVELGKMTGVSRTTIDKLEAGSGKISTLIAALRNLGQLEILSSLTHEPSVAPLSLNPQLGKKIKPHSRLK